MKFVIEPAQTYWNSDSAGVVKCRLRVPKGSVVLAMEANHLLVKRPVLESIPENRNEDHEWIGLVGLQLGFELDGDGSVGVFLGVMRLTHTMASFAVFATEPQSTIVYQIQQTFNAVDPERVAKIFKDEMLRLAERQRSETIPPDPNGA